MISPLKNKILRIFSPKEILIANIKGILAAPPKATPPKTQGLIKGPLTIGFP